MAERLRRERPAERTQEKESGLRQRLLDRTKRAFDRKDSFGKFGSYILEEYQDRQWKCLEGNHTIDIIPYVAGPNHPELKEGEPDFKLDVYVHNKIGANEDQFICLSRMYNKPCPICEDQRALIKSGAEDDAIKSLNPQRRTLYNILVHDNDKEYDKGVQIWDVAQRFMDKHLSARAKNSKTGEFINYAMPDDKEGRTITFERHGMGQFNTDFLAHNFESRDYSIPEDILNEAFPLDQVIHIPTYDEVYEAHFGKSVPSEGDIPDFGNKEQDPEPTPSPRRERGKVADPNNPCPKGLRFGIDIESFPECRDCGEAWDKCADEERRLASLEEKKKEPGEKPKTKREEPKPASTRPRLRR